mgnify:CR=1 FL=1
MRGLELDPDQTAIKIQVTANHSMLVRARELDDDGRCGVVRERVRQIVGIVPSIPEGLDPVHPGSIGILEIPDIPGIAAGTDFG